MAVYGPKTGYTFKDINTTLWGMGQAGQVPNNTFVSVSTPVLVGSSDTWRYIGAASTYVYPAIKNDGSLWIWGTPTLGQGQLGLGVATASRSSPTQIGSLTTWSMVRSGNDACMAVQNNGTGWSWGSNYFGQLGLSSITHVSSPTQLTGSWKWLTIGNGDSSLLGSGYGIKSDGTLWSWGYNTNGALGLNDTVHRSSPTQLSTATNWKKVVGTAWSAVAIKTDGTLWTWGLNSQGALGDNTIVDKSSPVQIGSGSWQDVECSYNSVLAVANDGTLWSWGLNNYGQLGLNDLVHRSSPTQVGSLSNWSRVSFGRNSTSVALSNSGILYGWGYNGGGILGLGDTNHRSSPVQIMSGNGWTDVAAGGGAIVAINSPYNDLGDRYVSKDYLLDVYPNLGFGNLGNRTSPGLYTWGNNASGQLGQGNIVNYSSPTQVGSSLDWEFISSGANHSLAIKTNGTLWSWGWNSYGELGQNLITTTYRSSPVQVGSLTTWRQPAGGYFQSAAIRTDGTLWTWGRNFQGALGINAAITSDRSSPAQVGTGTDWAIISCGTSFMAALKTNGSLWAWGSNTVGSVGDNTTVHRSSPVQLGSLLDWKFVSAGGGGGGGFAAAIKNDGTLWTWGYSIYGQLGLGDTVGRSSPTKVGTNTDWRSVSVGQDQIYAIKNNGTLWVWGRNPNGELGLNDINSRSSPVQLGTLTNWKKVSANNGISILAIKTDGTLWAWGHNSSGALGDQTVTHRSSPIQIGSLNNWKDISANLTGVMGILDWSC